MFSNNTLMDPFNLTTIVKITEIVENIFKLPLCGQVVTDIILLLVYANFFM